MENTWNWSGPQGIRAWVTTRNGGVSAHPYDTMNISYASGDNVEHVRENRRRTLQHNAQRSLDELVMAQQVHAAQVTWVDGRDRGRGAFTADDAVAGADGLLTRDSNVVLGMGFADCAPIFFADVQGRAVGVVHAGWRGTVGRIQQEAVRLLEAEGIRPSNLRVAIGPSIGACCYEIDDPVRKRVLQTAGEAPLSPAKRDDHWMLDIVLAHRILLEQAGVVPSAIDVAGICTQCDHQYFSFRRDNRKTGRMGGFICLN